jgi:DNA replication protein DnaC
MHDVFHQYRHKTLDDYEICHDSQRVAADTVREYIGDLEGMRLQGRGLTFVGPSGVGKGFLASQVLIAAHEKGYRIEALEMASYVGLIKDKFDLHDLIKTSSDEVVDRYVSVTEHLRRIQGSVKRCADWVLFDDIGREFPSASGWSSMQLFDTLRFRFNRGLPFLLTSNMGLSDLNHRYSEGMTSLLNEATTIVAVGGQDYRSRGPEWSTAN